MGNGRRRSLTRDASTWNTAITRTGRSQKQAAAPSTTKSALQRPAKPPQPSSAEVGAALIAEVQQAGRLFLYGRATPHRHPETTVPDNARGSVMVLSRTARINKSGQQSLILHAARPLPCSRLHSDCDVDLTVTEGMEGCWFDKRPIRQFSQVPHSIRPIPSWEPRLPGVTALRDNALAQWITDVSMVASAPGRT